MAIRETVPARPTPGPVFSHRSFKSGPAVRGVLGSAAIEGPVISWVADHRKHQSFADVPGDPHSPQPGGGACGLAWDVVTVSPERPAHRLARGG